LNEKSNGNGNGRRKNSVLLMIHFWRREMTLLRPAKTACLYAACTLAVAMIPSDAIAQAAGDDGKNAETRMAPETTESIYLSNATGAFDLNEVQSALRNNFPRARIYGVAGAYAITVRATAEDMQGVKKVVAELDRPKKIYRVTYNVNDIENGKRTGAQHYSLIVASGGKTTLKQGNRVPLVTGMTGEKANAAQSSQVQYIDVGLNIEATIEGTSLRTKVEQSAVGDEKSGIVAPDPVIRQTMLEGTSGLSAGKPVVLGSIDVPGTTRHQEIEVTTELVSQ
jgi:type II secretory pathway component GspD/PulD (secretin)